MIGSGKKRMLLAILASVAVLVSGCGQDSITGSTADTEYTGQSIALPEAERPSAAGFLGTGGPSVTVLVSAQNGGTVRMGRCTLEFPPGALGADTPITIRQADPVAMVVEFEPHGIQFKKPVRVRMRVGDLISRSSTSVGVAWMNETTGMWEVVGKSAAGELAEADLWHFSRYESFED